MRTNKEADEKIKEKRREIMLMVLLHLLKKALEEHGDKISTEEKTKIEDNDQ